MSEKKLRKLNIKQKLFADWYIKIMHVTNAAKKAGYSEKTAYSIGSELLKKPEIQEYIKVRKTQLEELLGFNKSTVLQDLHTIKLKSMTAVPVMEFDRSERAMVQSTAVNDKGEEVGLYEYDSIGAIRAIENINKMMGYNEPDKVEDVTPINKKQPTTVVINKQYVNKESDQPTT